MSLGMIVGGALQGIGAGLGQKAQLDYEAMRQQALENLRSSNNRAEIGMRGAQDRDTATHKSKLDDTNDARHVARTTNSQIVVDNARTTNDIKIEQVKFGNDREMAKFKSALDVSADEIKQRIGAAIDAGQVKEVIKGGDGQYWAIQQDGQRVPTGIMVPEEGGGSILTKKPAPTATPKAAPTGQKPAGSPSLPKGWSVEEVK
jgi:hypothetical protein